MLFIRFSNITKSYFYVLYTNRTKTLWNFKIAADKQELL